MTIESKGNATIWGMFVGDNGDQLEIFNSKKGPFPPEVGTEGMIAMGWPAIGDLRMYANNYLDYVEKFQKLYSKPDESEQAFKRKANMPWNFAFTIKIGDWVICPASSLGIMMIGSIIGDYEEDFHDGTGLYGRRRADFVHTRKVRWEQVINESDAIYSKLNRIGQLTLSRRDLSPSELAQILSS
jgi:predicted Mrr-cat superfamily restriction endonuclease